ncbi:tetraacyldisaccharide 4'-kinase [Rufibacter roseus]|uniref:Tetraacyldisaccharide 4'-kinase n=1 Tax=Rufibacter roseus TaxID=1567108 RepID=A0ABW2DTN3_9BACT|nr:tetraacyldisaccharide 4'-kinase [Rufibacter roseus]
MRLLFLILRFLLLPFSWVYGTVMRARNYLYHHSFFSTYQAPVPVICVGNLAVGGTGKTPLVEYLARMLQPKKMAILSRGYKRQTKGFVLGSAKETAATLGDEPFQYLQNLPNVTVAVCEKRETGIKKLLELQPDLDIILLDDAFQHRAVTASTYLLLTDYNKVFTNDLPLPAGRLREPRSGAKRAQGVVVTKCPALLAEREKQNIAHKIGMYTKKGTPVFFSEIVYAAAVPFGKVQALGKKLVLVTGIANARPLVNFLTEEGYEIIRHFEFSDHAAYTPELVKEVVNFWGTFRDQGLSVLMTHKDAVKWQAQELEYVWQGLPVFYLPITVSFAEQEPSFDDFIRQQATLPGIGINS